MDSGYAWVTLATNDAYSLGALVLAHSLRRVGTKYELAVLVTPGITEMMREKLTAVFNLVQEVNVLDSKDHTNLALLARPELGVTFTKLHCWNLTRYEKCVFVDADTLVVKNCDELFEREEFSAAPDIGWPDCFNSGVFVFRPSQQTFAAITTFAASKGSFDGGDQGLLNMYFNDWAQKDISKHLPFIYNMCSTATYSYLPAFKQFGEDVRIIHFIGITKPWLQYFDTLTGDVQPPADSVHLKPLLQLWWNIFCDKVHPELSPVMATSTLAPIWHDFFPMPFNSLHPECTIYTDIMDKIYRIFHAPPPDFSEFNDPWENYCVENDSIIQRNLVNTADQNSYESMSINKSNEYNCFPAHVRHAYNQEQFDQFDDENKHQRMFSQTMDTPFEKYFAQKTQTSPGTNQLTVEDQVYARNEKTQPFSQNHCIRNQNFLQAALNETKKELSDNGKQRNCIEEHSLYTCDQFSVKNSYEHKKYHDTKNLQHNNQCKVFSVEHTNSKYINAQASVNIRHEYEENMHPRNLHYSIDRNYKESIVDGQTEKQKFAFPYPISKPCTDLHNVATQTKPHIMEHLENSNAGLAGALAQMTLGEPRSAQQLALEEHMRKQSWEQGQIDYMGRDSFDNIWKKICETLSLVPQQLPSPPKEVTKSLEATTVKTTTFQSVETTDEEDKPAGTEDSN